MQHRPVSDRSDVSAPASARSSRWLGRRYLFRVGRLRIPTFATLLYLGFACGVVLGGYETGVGYSRFAISAVILLVFALVGARIWFLIGHPEFVTVRPVACV